MPQTALHHFEDDLARAISLIDHAEGVSVNSERDQLVRSDILRSAWMFAVGALDAYFCDAYTDLVATTIICKSRQPGINLPDFFYEIRFPVRAILEPYTNNENWRWRMAARKMMERETVLRLETIQKLFNKFFRPNQKFFRDLLDAWIDLIDAKKRLFGVTRTAFSQLQGAKRRDAISDAWEQMQERYRTIFQRRHDCIHNCDRPRTAPQALQRAGTVLKVVQDIRFLVARSDEHIRQEFRQFLIGCGCSNLTLAQAGY